MPSFLVIGDNVVVVRSKWEYFVSYSALSDGEQRQLVYSVRIRCNEVI